MSVIDEIEVVQFAIVELGVENFANELVDVAHLPVYVLFEHAEALGGVEDLESSNPAQELHAFVV